MAYAKTIVAPSGETYTNAYWSPRLWDNIDKDRKRMTVMFIPYLSLEAKNQKKVPLSGSFNITLGDKKIVDFQGKVIQLAFDDYVSIPALEDETMLAYMARVSYLIEKDWKTVKDGDTYKSFFDGCSDV